MNVFLSRSYATFWFHHDDVLGRSFSLPFSCMLRRNAIRIPGMYLTFLGTFSRPTESGTENDIKPDLFFLIGPTAIASILIQSWARKQAYLPPASTASPSSTTKGKM